MFVNADPSRKEESLKRYGAIEGVLARRPGEDVIDASGRWFQHAKVVLARDGYHHPLVLLVGEDGQGELNFLNIHDRATLNVLMRRLADEVERAGSVGLIHIGEFWAANLDDLKLGESASESPKRKEVLQVPAATADGRMRIHSIEFRKNEQGVIEFGDEWITDEPDAGGFLEPVRRVWRRWSERSQPPAGQQRGRYRSGAERPCG